MNRKRVTVDLYLEWQRRPFAWGGADCLSFAGAVAEAITGTDPSRRLRGRYSSEVGARRVMAREGWNDMGDVAAALAPEIPVGWAVSGDWAHVRDSTERECIGVVCGHMVMVRTEQGMGQMPLSRALRAFQVGER